MCAIPEDKGDVPHPNVSLTRWFDRHPDSPEEAYAMANSCKEYSAARKLAWAEKCKGPVKIQAMANQVASLSHGCISHHQGMAAALPPKGTTETPPAKADRAASSPPDLKGSGSSGDVQPRSRQPSKPAEPVATAEPSPTPTAAEAAG